MSFMEIFQPGLKHLREERERQRMNVAHPTDGADPLMKIDLDAGTATIMIAALDQSSETHSTTPDATESDTAAETPDPAADEHSESSMDEHDDQDQRASRPSTD
jgi:TATA-binding protein-associated factor Taf7